MNKIANRKIRIKTTNKDKVDLKANHSFNITSLSSFDNTNILN